MLKDAHSGAAALRLDNTEIRQGPLSLKAGHTYKVLAWVKIVSESGEDWGGFRIEVVDTDWRSLTHSGSLRQASFGREWRKIALRFTATSPTVILLAGFFGGEKLRQEVWLDDLSLIEDPPENRSPEVRAILSPMIIEAPGMQIFQLHGDDPDGAITHVVWEFGDGTRAFGRTGERYVGIPGQYVARVIVVDDEGAVVRQALSWSARRARYPEVRITDPSRPSATVRTPAIVMRGTATHTAQVIVSSDRGFFGVAQASPQWAITVPLAPGWNRIHAHQAECLVRYLPSEPLRISGVSVPREVERWEPAEITFHVEHSAATHPQFPYDPNPGPGLEWLDGITVEGVFTPDGGRTLYRRPAFFFQPYERALKGGEEWLYPSGPPLWCVRFAPPSDGLWQFRLEGREAKGAFASEMGQFQAIPPRNPLNRGPIRVSPTDHRYFEFADGTPFLGAGHGLGFSDELFSYDAEKKFEAIGRGNQNFFRWWLSGQVWSSAWQPWSSRTLPYEGTVPATALSLESAYGNGLAAWKLDAANPILFQGFMSGHAGLIPGRPYRVRVRWRTDRVTGPARSGAPYGVCVKWVGWPEPGQTIDLPAVVAHVHGDTPWHVAIGRFTAESDLLPNLALILENTTDGRAFVDECVVEEELPDGRLGPNLLRSPAANSHLCFDPRRGAAIEHILREAQRRGLYFKLVISEKQEYLLNHFSPQGLPDPHGQHFNRGKGSPTWRLHHYYWRHLSARFGAFRSVHSWELVNEEAPGPGEHFALTAAAARWASTDGNPHLVSTSTWAGLAPEAWKHPVSAPISYVDFHCYARATGWIEPRDELAEDSARFFAEYDQAVRAANFGKPVVWGEMGIDGRTEGSDDEEPRLMRDRRGIWLHKMLWARCGPGGVYPLYWWTENIFQHRLHTLFGNWNRFMEGIPLSNGRYRDAEVTSSNPNIRGWGQKDLRAGRAHLWLDHAAHTWLAEVDGRPLTAQDAEITVPMGAPHRSYRVIWYDPYKGRPVHEERLAADARGVLRLSVRGLHTDLALRIEAQ